MHVSDTLLPTIIVTGVTNYFLFYRYFMQSCNNYLNLSSDMLNNCALEPQKTPEVTFQFYTTWSAVT